MASHHKADSLGPLPVKPILTSHFERKLERTVSFVPPVANSILERVYWRNNITPWISIKVLVLLVGIHCFVSVVRMMINETRHYRTWCIAEGEVVFPVSCASWSHLMLWCIGSIVHVNNIRSVHCFDDYVLKTIIWHLTPRVPVLTMLWAILRTANAAGITVCIRKHVVWWQRRTRFPSVVALISTTPSAQNWNWH